MSAGDIFVTDADKRIAALLEDAVTNKYHDHIATQAMERVEELEEKVEWLTRVVEAVIDNAYALDRDNWCPVELLRGD